MDKSDVHLLISIVVSVVLTYWQITASKKPLKRNRRPKQKRK